MNRYGTSITQRHTARAPLQSRLIWIVCSATNMGGIEFGNGHLEVRYAWQLCTWVSDTQSFLISMHPIDFIDCSDPPCCLSSL